MTMIAKRYNEMTFSEKINYSNTEKNVVTRGSNMIKEKFINEFLTLSAQTIDALGRHAYHLISMS